MWGADRQAKRDEVDVQPERKSDRRAQRGLADDRELRY